MMYMIEQAGQLKMWAYTNINEAMHDANPGDLVFMYEADSPVNEHTVYCNVYSDGDVQVFNTFKEAQQRNDGLMMIGDEARYVGVPYVRVT